MKKTLENLLNKGIDRAKSVKNAFVKAGTLVGLIGSLIYLPQKANAEVLFTMEATSTRDFPSRVWNTNGTTLKLFVNVDNTEEDKPTSEVQWKVEYPSDFTLFTIKQPDPYIQNCVNGDNCQIEEDFFYNQPMPSKGSPTNSVSLENSIRSTRTLYDFNGNSYRFGPEKKQGRLAIFYFFNPKGISLDKPIGTNSLKVAYRKIRITNTKAYATDGSEQKSQGSEMTVMFIPNYDLLNDNVFILQDRNFSLPHLHVTDFSKRTCLEASRDGKTFSPIATNNNPYMSFNYIDKDATNYQSTIYRARSIEENSSNQRKNP